MSENTGLVVCGVGYPRAASSNDDNMISGVIESEPADASDGSSLRQRRERLSAVSWSIFTVYFYYFRPVIIYITTHDVGKQGSLTDSHSCLNRVVKFIFPKHYVANLDYDVKLSLLNSTHNVAMVGRVDKMQFLSLDSVHLPLSTASLAMSKRCDEFVLTFFVAEIVLMSSDEHDSSFPYSSL
ncbi:hypothetical protein J6590_062633 [Homalodisca vitripennis]|nr:hypothetical protein J6590_062633 [Homalodisca vitripennis]